MGPVSDLIRKLSPKNRRAFLGLGSPQRIQSYLDSIEYCNDNEYSCPVSTMESGRGCCFEGALLAAAAFRRIGLPPLIVEMTAVRDDDHILAVYRKEGHWGAVAKSNYVGLRSREPVYRSIRELVMSYFELFFNLQGEKSMRTFSRPLNLARLDHHDWMVRDDNLDAVAEALEGARHVRLFTRAMLLGLRRVDSWTYKALMVGTDVSKAYHEPG